jgi:hypothetical protein
VPPLVKELVELTVKACLYHGALEQFFGCGTADRARGAAPQQQQQQARRVPTPQGRTGEHSAAAARDAKLGFQRPGQERAVALKL